LELPEIEREQGLSDSGSPGGLGTRFKSAEASHVSEFIWSDCCGVPDGSLGVGFPFVHIWEIGVLIVAASAPSTGGREANLGKDGFKVRSL